MAEKKIVITKRLMKRAEELSAEWNNTCFIVMNPNYSLEAVVWNNYQYEDPRRPVVAHVCGEGWKIKDDKYYLARPLIDTFHDQVYHEESRGPKMDGYKFVLMHPKTYMDLVNEVDPFSSLHAGMVGQPWAGKKCMVEQYQIFRSEDIEEGEFKFKLF